MLIEDHCMKYVSMKSVFNSSVLKIIEIQKFLI